MKESIYFLHPNGDDRNDGLTTRSGPRRRGPWATLAGARDRLRELRAAGKLAGPANVLLADGIYLLREPVEFSHEDSHTIYAAAPRAVPVLDGGERLTGWREETLHGQRAWVLDLPEVAAGRWYFRSLFVNGQRRPRARLPKFSPDAEGVKNIFRIGELRFPEKRKLFDGDHVFKPRAGDVQDWSSLWDADVVLLHYWIETRLGSARFDSKTGWLRCARRSVFNLYESFNPKLARYYIDNLFEALTEPGEWYLDRTEGRLYYLPLPGEKMASTNLIAPRTEAFIQAAGEAFNHGQTPHDPLGGKLVTGLRFEGLTFRHGDWSASVGEFSPHDCLRPSAVPLGGSPQAAMHVPAAIEFRWARHCAVERCTVERIGLHAVDFGQGCRDCCLAHSTLHDLGAGGVRVHGTDLDGAIAGRTGHINVSDNRITDIGRIFHQGVGILVGNAFGCTVAHNEVARTCYTAISVGWSWGYRETISRDHRIENNFIHDIGQGVLSDMGAIYLLGVQPGTVVRGNHIHTVTNADYGGWGIYPDEGSSHLLIENNWVHDTQGSPLRIHFARELVVRNNVFARSAQESLVGIGRVENHIAATLLHNVLLGPAPFFFEVPHP
ncbi:MAG: right-handed parallel beta-helix repeat-containing protein [Verrucomicrobiota bacterium]